MDRFEVDFFRFDNGESPVEEYLDGTEIKMRAKILWTIALLEKNGNMLTMPYSKHLDDGIFELRTKLGSNISRVLYFFFVGRKIILTHGFDKKTDKVLKNEIETAKRYREIYLSKHGKEK